jgi:hypothetical protein
MEGGLPRHVHRVVERMGHAVSRDRARRVVAGGSSAEGHLAERRAKNELRRCFPDLNDAMLGRTMAQAMYFTSK